MFSTSLEWIILLSAGVAALAFLSKRIRRAIKRLVLMTNRQKTINEIADEFKTNGGLSLKDAIDRIEKRQEETAELLLRETHKDNKWKGEVFKRLGSMEKHLEKHHNKIENISLRMKECNNEENNA